MEETRINVKFKDRLFTNLFGKHKENLLSLYNALNGTSYKNVDDLEINTIDDVVYMGMKNDVSCIIDDYLTLHEHQSTFNPNMPLRGMLYSSKLYDKYMNQHPVSIYSKHLLKIPTPKYFVLYNGDEEMPDIKKLRLSDAFIHPVENGEFEWTATMVNINYGHNRDILEKCPALNEYAILVAKVKEYCKGKLSVKQSVQKAVDDCIDKGILKEYLLAHKAEVVDMVLTEYDEARTLELARAEARTEALEEGRAEEHAEYLRFVKSLHPGMTDEEAEAFIEQFRGTAEK